MTITDAITKVLCKSNTPLGHTEIYNTIINQSYYKFGAKDPISVVRSKIRKHCYGLDFPSASPKKLFIQVNVNKKSKTPLYQIWDGKTQNNEIAEIILRKDELPEEKIHISHSEHLELVGKQLLENIKIAEPEFFESLVVKLLLKMGYGWDQSSSGNVVGGSGDDGIDGIINEDKLGLEKIYIQAKRYTENKVSPSEIRDFIGAMVIKGARKGVYFTSSDYTEQAKKHAADAQNMTITLIDGKLLTELLVQYGLGVAIINSYNIYEVDKNYFSLD